MVLFLGDIAFMLEVMALAAGLVVLYFAQERASGLLKAAGYILAVGGALGILCSGFYWVKYWSQGAFMSAHPMSMQGGGPMMGHGGMPMRGMMGGGMMSARHEAMTEQMDQCIDKLSGRPLDAEGMKAMHRCVLEGMQSMMEQGQMAPGMMGQGQMRPGMMGSGPMWQECMKSLEGQEMGPEMRQAMRSCMQGAQKP